jgi:hypothetical protein
MSLRTNNLAHIYRADQCTDSNDTNMAMHACIAEIRLLKATGRKTGHAERRLRSLQLKHSKLLLAGK